MRRDNFACFSIKIYAVATHQNDLAEAILMGTHNIGFMKLQKYLSVTFITNYHRRLPFFGILLTVRLPITNSTIMVMKQFCYGLAL